MFPIILALIPLFVLFRKLDLINNPLSVIILYTVFQLPFATWMARSFFDTIPKDLEEAAMIDGCSRLRTLVRIVLPLSGPGIAAISIFSFLFSYNEFFVANIFLRDESAMTLPVGITMFMQQYETDWGSLMAAATVTLIPTFLLFLGVQKYIAYGAVVSQACMERTCRESFGSESSVAERWRRSSICRRFAISRISLRSSRSAT
jgi:ABC-type glycerol-3-phosphate transport system permease component